MTLDKAGSSRRPAVRQRSPDREVSQDPALLQSGARSPPRGEGRAGKGARARSRGQPVERDGLGLHDRARCADRPAERGAGGEPCRPEGRTGPGRGPHASPLCGDGRARGAGPHHGGLEPSRARRCPDRRSRPWARQLRGRHGGDGVPRRQPGPGRSEHDRVSRRTAAQSGPSLRGRVCPARASVHELAAGGVCHRGPVRFGARHRRAASRDVAASVVACRPMTTEEPLRTMSETASDLLHHCGMLVGDTGIEPVTSSVSGKRATAAPIARA